MKVKFLLKAAGIALLSSIALAKNDCDDIKSYLDSRGQNFKGNVEKCEVDSKGKVTKL